MADSKDELEVALRVLNDLVRDGLEHGFFNYTVRGDVVNGRNRRLTIEAGKSVQITIPREKFRG